MAKELQEFDFDDVVKSISDKMINRHPHVFSSERIRTVDSLSKAWEEHKQNERHVSDPDKSALGGVALALPALARAEKLQRRAARVGFDWRDSSGPRTKIDEELAELDAETGGSVDSARLGAEVGDVLFACVNLARHLNVDAEQALRSANSRFERRFRRMERRLADAGRSPADASLEELDALWEEAKRPE
jgi:MazG family protein